MRTLNRILLVAVLIALGGAVAMDASRRGRVVEAKGWSGAVERCPTCHPNGVSAKVGRKAHPEIPGHKDLAKYGCVACHGGDGRRVDRGAHRPLPGEGHPPFYPRPHFEVGCARCHVIGKLEGGARLARGQREYLESGCVSCHLPGRRQNGLAFDLRYRPARTVEYIREHLIDPSRAGSRAKMMWSLRDATYRDRFAATADGEEALDALITYLLALGESPEPYQKVWHKAKLKVDTDCMRCHHLGGKKTTGARHTCPMLVPERTEINCERCHGTPATVPRNAKGLCPQLRALQPVCNTCHLRPGDGTANLAGR